MYDITSTQAMFTLNSSQSYQWELACKLTSEEKQKYCMFRAEQLVVQNGISDKRNDLCKCPEVSFYHGFFSTSSDSSTLGYITDDPFKTWHKVN